MVTVYQYVGGLDGTAVKMKEAEQNCHVLQL